MNKNCVAYVKTSVHKNRIRAKTKNVYIFSCFTERFHSTTRGGTSWSRKNSGAFVTSLSFA